MTNFSLGQQRKGSIVSEEHRAIQLLVSVRNLTEAKAALEGGADWIDFKEPNHGTLGPVNFDIAQEMVSSLEGTVPLSAALGEFVDWQANPRRQLPKIPGVQVIKLGLAGCGDDHSWEDNWLACYEFAAADCIELVAVAYADWREANAPDPWRVIEIASRVGAKFFLIDTHDKRARSSLQVLEAQVLSELLESAGQLGMTTVLAGKLRIEDIPAVVKMDVDILAVRGAVCRTDRTGELDRMLVKEFRDSLRRAARSIV